MEADNKKRRSGSIPMLLLIGLIMICLPLALVSAAPIVWQNSSHSDPITPDDQWAGWRGLEKDGQVAVADTPMIWSPQQNVKWRTPIPGKGYSSPIVYGNRVFLTTAYETVKGLARKRAANLAAFLLLLVITVTANRLLVDLTHAGTFQAQRTQYLVHLLFEVALILLIGFVLFGRSVLDYSGTRDTRSWLSSEVGVFLGLLLAGYCLSPRSRQRVLLGAVMILFSIVFPATIPMPARAYLYEIMTWAMLLRSDSLVILSLPGLFALVGLYHVIGWFFSRRKTTLHERSETPPGKAPCLRHIAVVKGAAIVLLTLGLTSALAVIGSSEYLGHHLARRALFAPMSGWWSVWLIAFAYLFTAPLFVAKTRTDNRPDGATGWLFRGGLSLLVILIFVDVNFLSVRTELIRAVIAIDRDNGQVRWVTEGLTGAPGTMSSENSAATPTPVTDGERIYAYFGSAGLMGVDYQGNILWENDDFKYENIYGAATSPVVRGGVLVLVIDTPESPYIVGVDTRTGKRIWATPRDNRGFNFNGVSRTPLLRRLNGRDVAVVWGVREMTMYDLRTGEEIRQHPVAIRNHADRIASPIMFAEDRVFLASGGNAVVLDLGVSDSDHNPVVWIAKRLRSPNCASPVFARGLLFMVSDSGHVTCLDAGRGEVLWQKRLPGEYRASPVATGDRIFFCNTAGLTTVVAAERTYRKISTANLSAKVISSFAVAGGQLFIRTENDLFCIAEER